MYSPGRVSLSQPGRTAPPSLRARMRGDRPRPRNRAGAPCRFLGAPVTLGAEGVSWGLIPAEEAT